MLESRAIVTSSLSQIYSTQIFRMLLLLMGFLGIMNASFQPYQSLIGIEKLGLSPEQFAWVLVMTSVVGVSASVLIGVLTDQRSIRREVALLTSGLTLIGSLLMLALPSQTSFVLANGVFLAMGTSLFSQFLALNRLASSAYPAQREAIQAGIRATMSFTYLAMLLLWMGGFALGMGVMATYLGSAVAACAMLVLIWKYWPKAGHQLWEERSSGLRLSDALMQLARPAVTIRVACLGCVQSTAVLYVVLTALVFDASPLRDTGDVSLYVGMVAGWEVPFMLLLPRMMGHLPRNWLILGGTAIYCIHLALIPVLVDSPLLWVLPFFGGLGATGVLLLPLSYYQDLMQDQPGAAGALVAVQRLFADCFSAAIFALGLAWGGYGLSALMDSGLAIGGAALLIVLDRFFPLRAKASA